ncbi:hypothetical protein UFOVP187_36 [uncultured Caudovirales phage]|uniref:Uncharacterized protein n=1 Tax=uncultured Caudovirales phage TaxID=2100421 RepID=A0A6J7WKC7_9CAUD|nr:hypothetical protein UFOVP187_36 [uncultured Caudovirales phage]
MEKVTRSRIDNLKGKNGKCESCKKKKPITELPPLVEENVWVPTSQDIRLAFVELSNMKGVSLDKREFINKVYSFIFNEEFNFDCGGCVANQGRKFQHYINQLKD